MSRTGGGCFACWYPLTAIDITPPARIATSTADRFIRLSPNPYPTCLRLRFLGLVRLLVVWRAGAGGTHEQLAAVGKSQVTAVRAIRPVLRLVSLDDDFSA